MSKARYLCFEGVEGVGKTTQCKLLVEKLRAMGYKVLETKEPGTNQAPLTMQLRGIMLDKQYDEALTLPARELISQAIRSIHIEKVIYPNLDEYDFIVQDRGMLSGLSYGVGCGNEETWIKGLLQHVVDPSRKRSLYNLYDNIILLQGNVAKGLTTALGAKQEFKAGDAIEAKGVSFMQDVARHMSYYSKSFNGVRYINVDGKSIEEVSKDIMEALEITGKN